MVLVQRIVTEQSSLVRLLSAINHLISYDSFSTDEHSRVKLPELSGDPLSSYINANYVKGFPDESRTFIATQGPLANTIIDFYRMIWQEHVPVVVMITRLFEKNKVGRTSAKLIRNRNTKFRQNVKDIFQTHEVISTDRFKSMSNQFLINQIMKYVV